MLRLSRLRFRYSLCTTSLAFTLNSNTHSYTTPSVEMNLLDLPVELVSNILLQAVIARGIKRALRLRLVNSKFYSWLIQHINQQNHCRAILSRCPICSIWITTPRLILHWTHSPGLVYRQESNNSNILAFIPCIQSSKLEHNIFSSLS
jgi:hypothetical protein